MKGAAHLPNLLIDTRSFTGVYTPPPVSIMEWVELGSALGVHLHFNSEYVVNLLHTQTHTLYCPTSISGHVAMVFVCAKHSVMHRTGPKTQHLRQTLETQRVIFSHYQK